MDFLVRIGLYLLILICAFGAGFVRGCQHEQAEYKEAEVKFIERVKVVKEIEKVEVVKFKTEIKWLKETEVQFIEAAKNEAPNPAVCDFSPDRLRRLKLAATGVPG